MSNQNVLFICLVIIVAALVAEYAKKPKKGEEAAMLSECEDKVMKVENKSEQSVYNGKGFGYNASNQIVNGSQNVAFGYQSLVHLGGSQNVGFPADTKIKTVPERIDSHFDKRTGIKIFVKTWSTGNTSAWGE